MDHANHLHNDFPFTQIRLFVVLTLTNQQVSFMLENLLPYGLGFGGFILENTAGQQIFALTNSTSFHLTLQ